jgi:hypothetical protein
MSFAEQLKKTLDNEYNVSITENGARGYKTTNHSLLDMNFKVSSYRKRSENEIIQDFMNAFREDKILAMRWLFYARDVREGLGERRLFRAIVTHLAKDETFMMRSLVPLFAEYGRYDDLIALLDTPVKNTVIGYIKETLTKDMEAVASNKSASLLAKWLPSENASSAKTRANARVIIKGLGISPAQYRKMLSKIRSYLNVVEKKMSTNNWNEIDYEAVPSKANLLYNSAFLRHDEERRRAFLGAVEKGEAKINSSVTFPHEIVHKYMSGRGYYYFDKTPVDQGLEALWKALPNLVKGDESTLVVADGSGSMTTTVGGGSSVSALSVANALAIYFAERASGDFKNKYITFSSRPQLVNLNGKTLRDNISIALQHSEVSNTNIEATFDLILNTAIRGGMSQEDMPKNILVISDMEFDSATYTYGVGRPNAKLFDTINAKFVRAGYKMPRLVFWNVCGRTNTIPVIENDAGVALVSGFSVNILNMVMGNSLDPYQLLVETLNTERYDTIEWAITDHNENIQ